MPPPYVPPTPVPDGGGDGRGKRRLVIGGAILAAVALAVIAFLALSGDDDDPKEQVADRSDTTTTTEESDDGPESLEDLEDACADGDFSACDDLYYSADLGSDMEEFGSTCGGIADPQEGSCEATNGGEDALPTDGLGDGFGDGDIEEILADTYAEMFDLTDEQAECLAGKIADAIEDGSLNEEQAATEVFDYLSDCDISLEDIGAN
jgi:hypothetical protein